MSGYTDCSCRDCFEIAIGKRGIALCHACAAAECEPNDGECCREDLGDEDPEAIGGVS